MTPVFLNVLRGAGGWCSPLLVLCWLLGPVGLVSCTGRVSQCAGYNMRAMIVPLFTLHVKPNR